MNIQLILGDCFDILPTIPTGSVHAIITDLPYGNKLIDSKWDHLFNLAEMWRLAWNALVPNGVFITTANQPFTSKLVMSQPRKFKHEWIWLKSHGSNFMTLKRGPLKKHESVLVFGNGRITYNPQMTTGKAVKKRIGKFESERKTPGAIGAPADLSLVLSDQYYPVTPQFFKSVPRNKSVHPTQKPVELYEYLVNTYTNPGDTVLDFVMGSGTTGAACVNTGRNFIGIERDEKYYNVAKERIAQLTG